MNTQELVNQIPNRLRKALYPFQREGVLSAIKKQGRLLIGDEMGLGKTIQSISVACAFRDWPCLIVAPAVVKLNWVDEIEKWTGCEPGTIRVVEGRQDVDSWKDATFVVCSYGLFTRESPVSQQILGHNFATVIVDESHSLKNHQAVRTQAIVPIIELATRAILLSGTPALAKPVELYPQVAALSKGIFGTYSQYTRKFCNARKGRFGWDVSGAKNLPELHTLLENVMIRRLKSAVLTQLPDKIKSRVLIDLEPRAKKVLAKTMAQLKDAKAIMSETLEAEQSGDRQARQAAFGAHIEQRRLLMQAFHETGIAKLPGAKGYINNFLDSCPDNKCLIFAHHRDVLDGLETNISEYRFVPPGRGKKKKKIGYMRIDGSTPHRERADNVRKFQSDPNCRVAIIGMLAGGVGITLTAASHVFFAELHWTPGVLHQAEDRAHRIGQTAENVHINYLVAKGSLDDAMWSMLCSKVNVVSMCLIGRKEKLKIKARKIQESSNTTPAKDEDCIDVAKEDRSDATPSFSRGDVRGFMFGQVKTASTTKEKDREWSCHVCTLVNICNKHACAACGTSRVRVTDGVSDVSRQSEDGAGISVGPADLDRSRHREPQFYYYAVSSYTGRIFLYSNDKEYLYVSFMPEEIKTVADYKEKISNHIVSAQNSTNGTDSNPGKTRGSFQEVRTFLKKWNNLRAIEQQLLCANGFIFRTPLMPLLNRKRLEMKQKCKSLPSASRLSFTRFSKAPSPPKIDSPGEASSTHGEGHEGAVTSRSISNKCLVCDSPAAEGSQCCSYECDQEWKVRTSGSHIRRVIFELESGVCQICKRDMHEFFLRYRRLPPSDRFQELLRMKFCTNGLDLKSAHILHNPNEGHFWQADHILPVSEGGGECDMTNLRTLCTPCHQRETKSLKERLNRKRLAESAKGTFDIRSFMTQRSNSSCSPNYSTPSTENRPKKKSRFDSKDPASLSSAGLKSKLVSATVRSTGLVVGCSDSSAGTCSDEDDEEQLTLEELTAKYINEQKVFVGQTAHPGPYSTHEASLQATSKRVGMEKPMKGEEGRVKLCM